MSEKYVCEGCNEQTLDRIDQTCPMCGVKNEPDHMRVGWDESD